MCPPTAPKTRRENLRMECGLTKDHTKPEVLVSHEGGRLTVVMGNGKADSPYA